MEELKMIGTIKWYSKQKGYGYIIGADDEQYYFESLSFEIDNSDYKDGDLVLFVPNFEEVNYATKIEKKVEEKYE